MVGEPERRGIARFEGAGRGSQAKGCGWPLEGGKAMKTDSPPETPERNTALPTLILA